MVDVVGSICFFRDAFKIEKKHTTLSMKSVEFSALGIGNFYTLFIVFSILKAYLSLYRRIYFLYCIEQSVSLSLINRLHLGKTSSDDLNVVCQRSHIPTDAV